MRLIGDFLFIAVIISLDDLKKPQDIVLCDKKIGGKLILPFSYSHLYDTLSPILSLTYSFK